VRAQYTTYENESDGEEMALDVKTEAELPNMPKMPQLIRKALVPGEVGRRVRVKSCKLPLHYSLHLSNMLFALKAGSCMFDEISCWLSHMTVELDSSKLPGQLYQPLCLLPAQGTQDATACRENSRRLPRLYRPSRKGEIEKS
jgi:hypothetical protein